MARHTNSGLCKKYVVFTILFGVFCIDDCLVCRMIAQYCWSWNLTSKPWTRQSRIKRCYDFNIFSTRTTKLELFDFNYYFIRFRINTYLTSPTKIINAKVILEYNFVWMFFSQSKRHEQNCGRERDEIWWWL